MAMPSNVPPFGKAKLVGRSGSRLLSRLARRLTITVRYLGIEVDDALAIAEQIDV